MIKKCSDCLMFRVSLDAYPCKPCMESKETRPFHCGKLGGSIDGNVYYSSQSLRGEVLQVGDWVVFNGYKYMVKNEYLSCLGGGDVFRETGYLEQRANIAAMFYGERDLVKQEEYRRGRALCGGWWPEYDIDVHAKGLTDFVLWLFSVLESRDREQAVSKDCNSCVFGVLDTSAYPCRACRGFSNYLYDYDCVGKTASIETPAPIQVETPKKCGSRVVHSRAELLAGRALKHNDVVYFGKDKYTVERSGFLYGQDCNNDQMFKDLGMSEADKYNFADKVFGRNSGKGEHFPSGNMEELNKLVLALYSMHERVFDADWQLFGDLREDDVVYVQGIKHHVRSSFLHCWAGGNDHVFHVLGIDKIQVARETYGYSPYSGAWPECNEGDMPALTRLVRRLWCIEQDGPRTTEACTPDPAPVPAPVPVPASVFTSADDITHTLRSDDAVYIAGVKYTVIGHPGCNPYLCRITDPYGANGELFRELELNAWKLAYDLGYLNNKVHQHDSHPDMCIGWPECKDMESLTKFVKLVYALVQVHQAGSVHGQAVVNKTYSERIAEVTRALASPL